jgi:hypothetical protein
MLAFISPHQGEIYLYISALPRRVFASCFNGAPQCYAALLQCDYKREQCAILFLNTSWCIPLS